MVTEKKSNCDTVHVCVNKYLILTGGELQWAKQSSKHQNTLTSSDILVKTSYHYRFANVGCELLNYFIRNAWSLILICCSGTISPEGSRLLRVNILGVPNSGKSTLINQIVGFNICAHSPKVHTTRHNARAILTEENTQVNNPCKSTLQFCLKIVELLIYRILLLTPEEQAIFKQTSFTTRYKFFDFSP